ncbi:MAG: mannose-6-phosphate isomerase, class I, partial [Desulforhabdus sp.]|nr:mannose-6-phosphate isomerase, class I [Desulforhabdus sp.]
GRSAAARFAGTLPFLLKILAAERPLSIQAHPDLAQARGGFARENAAGISLNNPIRNYRDENHKPEILCALTPFWALKGFRSTGKILELIDRMGVPELHAEGDCIRYDRHGDGLRIFVTRLLEMERGRQRNLVDRAALAAQSKAGSDPLFDWIVRLSQIYAGDIGALSPIFLNLIRLEPGEAMYIESGTMHAYLSGTGIELMANSDNVLRGGLTTKHIDLGELFNILRFADEMPIVVPATNISAVESVYGTAAKEFVLSIIRIGRDMPYISKEKRSVEILICTQGHSVICDAHGAVRLDFNQGKSVIVPACVGSYRIEGQATFYKASVPLEE